jgi:hypothetical protein
MSEQRPATPTTASANRNGPNTSEPSVERQAELRAAYEANAAAGKPPYEKMRIRTLGELQWILRERDWSGDLHPAGKQRPDLSGADFHSVNLSGAGLYEAIVDLAPRLPHGTLDSRMCFGDIDW